MSENPTYQELEQRVRELEKAESERKQTEEALLESEAFIKAVLDNLPIGIAVNSVDPSVKFEYMNDNFPKCYRTSRAALADPDAFWNAVYEDPEFREAMKTGSLLIAPVVIRSACIGQMCRLPVKEQRHLTLPRGIHRFPSLSP